VGAWTQNSSVVESLVEEMLANAPQMGRTELDAWRKPREELRRLARLDYVRIMRRTLGFHEMRAVLGEARKVWPNLNRAQLRAPAPTQYAEIASDLNVHFQATPYAGPEGMALRGFYVSKLGSMLKRPLIYVNTAHHPGAVSATFCHEVGHYVTSKLLRPETNAVHFFFGSAHYQHLRDPLELAADAVVSLAAYPESLARTIFAVPWNWGLVARADELPERAFARIRSHVKELCGIDFGGALPIGQSFHYLAGMIHYAKLRWALLSEYDL
jgi:hypothetical protein